MDVCIALSLLGSDWDLADPIVEHTEDEWNGMRWWDNRAQPTWGDLVAAWESRPAAQDFPVWEVEKLLAEYPTFGWLIIDNLGL